jgi:hypothetical protein
LDLPVPIPLVLYEKDFLSPNSKGETKMTILLYSVGTLGDIQPFLRIAQSLKKDGHQIRFASNKEHQKSVTNDGFTFIELPPSLSTENLNEAEKLMNPRSGVKYLLRDLYIPQIKVIYDRLNDAVSDCELMISGSLAYAASMIHEVHGIQWISIGLQPAFFIDEANIPMFAHAPWLHPFTSRSKWVSRLFLNFLRLESYTWCSEWRQLRRELRLNYQKNPVITAGHSPQLELAAFPKVFAGKMQGWPENRKCVGFPLGPSGTINFSKDLQEFLEIHQRIMASKKIP